VKEIILTGWELRPCLWLIGTYAPEGVIYVEVAIRIAGKKGSKLTMPVKYLL